MIKRGTASLRAWATVDPFADNEPMVVHNRVNGTWTTSKASPIQIVDPLNKQNTKLQLVQNTQFDEIEPFLESLRQCKKSGLHNPLKNPQR